MSLPPHRRIPRRIWLFILVTLIAALAAPISAQHTDLTFTEAPFRLKNRHLFDPAIGFREQWSVGGAGSFGRVQNGSQIQTTISKKDLNSLYVIDFLVSIVVGNDGEILTSSDHGQNWHRITSGTKNNLTAVFCVDAGNCWIAGDGLIFKGGIEGDWKQVRAVPTERFQDLYAVSDKTVYAVGLDNLAIVTTDGGVTWKKIKVSYKGFGGRPPHYDAIAFRNESTGCFAGSEITVCTQNGGKQWYVRYPEAYPQGVVWKDKDIFLVGKYGDNLVSGDNGKSWRPVEKESASARGRKYKK